MENTKPCPSCGELIQDTALKCKHCGKSLLEMDSSDDMATNLYWDGFGDESKLTETPNTQTNLTPEEQVKFALSTKYNIIGEIGRGGMAIIYKAVQKNLNREVALKVLPKQFTHDEEYLARFHREAREVAKLNHPNIITIFDEGIEGDVHYLAMELLEGKDLQETIKEQHTLSIELAVSTIAPIAEALDYLHNKELVHRDIKSSNIFLDRNNRPVLMDFGIARTTGNTKLTQAGTIMGTPEYMSPEQAEGKPVDGRSDLYSLGVVLYECLSSSVPFKADNPITIIRKIVDETPISVRKYNSNVPKWFDDIILKLLSKSPNDRIQSGVALSESLRSKKLTHGKVVVQRSDKTVKINTNDLTDSKKTVKLSSNSLSNSGKNINDNHPEGKNKAGLIFIISFILVIALGSVFYFTMFRKVEHPEEKSETTVEEKAKNIVPIIDSTNVPNISKESVDTIKEESKSLKNDLPKTTDNIDKSSNSIKSQSDKNMEEKTAEQRKVNTEKNRNDRLTKQIKQLESELDSAKKLESMSLKKYEHAKRMREKKMLSPGDFKSAEENYYSAVAKVKQLILEIEQLKNKL